MSNQENNNQKSNNKIKYYSSVHQESGFVNSLTLVESQHGSDYYAIKFAARRGNSEKPKTAPFSVRVNGKQAKQVIEQIASKVKDQFAANKKLWDAGKGKESLAILITLNVSDTVAKSYLNKHTSKDVVYIDGRCTSISYVRIGDEVVFQKEAVKEETQKVETNTVNDKKEENVKQETPVDTSTGELAEEVTLDPKAEDFQARKDELKELGYSWNKENKVWSLNKVVA